MTTTATRSEINTVSHMVVGAILLGCWLIAMGLNAAGVIAHEPVMWWTLPFLAVGLPTLVTGYSNHKPYGV